MTAPGTLLDPPAPQSTSHAAGPGARRPLLPPARRFRLWRVARWVLAGLALLGLVVALGSWAGSGSQGTTSSGPALGLQPGATDAAGRAGPVGPATAVSPALPGPAAVAPDSGTAVVPPSVSAERVVKTGQVELAARRGAVPETLTAVQQAAEAQGGLVSGSSTEEDGSRPSGSLTVRVPVAHFGALLLRVRTLGAGVHSVSSSSSDVTGQAVDLEAQSRTLRETRDQLLDIKRRATDVTDILTVQQRVDDVTGRLNTTEAQAAVLRDQAAMSTLTVTVREAGDPVFATEPVASSHGLGQAFRDARRQFGDGVEALVRASGGLLLLALCVAVLAAVGLAGRRLVRRLRPCPREVVEATS